MIKNKVKQNSLPIQVGDKFSSLTVLETGIRKNGRSFSRCLCICGEERTVYNNHLKTSHTKSCGCLSKPFVSLGRKDISDADLLNKIKKFISYNKDTGIFTRIKDIGSFRKGEIAGGVDSYGYITIGFNNRSYGAHRLAWLFTHGKFPNDRIDHKNEIKTDNRIDNLRDVTHGENMQNISKCRVDCSTGVKGVLANKRNKKSETFTARIKVGKKQIHIGCFKSKEEAGEAYLRYKKENHLFWTNSQGLT